MDHLDLLRADPWAALLTVSALKGALLLAATGLATLALRRASAATRHLVWTLAFAAVLVMPVLLVLIPGWKVPLLPAEGLGLLNAEPVEAMLPALSGSASAAVSVAERLSIESLLLALWALGALVVAARWLVAVIAATVFTRRAAPMTDPAWLDQTNRIRRALGIRRPVVLRISPRLRSPMTWGLLRPVVLIPPEATAWSADRRNAVLIHELAHIRRRDSLTQWLGQAVVALYWFNPLAWRGYRRMLIEREHACDDYVLQEGALPSAYATHLLQIARDLKTTPRAELAMASLARPSESQIEERLRSILSSTTRRDALSRGLLVIVGVLVLALVWPLAAIDPIAASPSTLALAPLPPLPPVAPSAPAIPGAPAAPAPSLAPPASPSPPGALAPPVEPAPEPVIVGVVRSGEPGRFLVEVGDPVSAARGPSAAGTYAIRIRREAPRAVQQPVAAAVVEGDQCRTRLDAAFAYEFDPSARSIRVDVSHLVQSADQDAWDALDRQANALASRMTVLADHVDELTATTWDRSGVVLAAGRNVSLNSNADVVVDLKRDVDNRARPTYRPGRRSSEECPEEGRQK